MALLVILLIGLYFTPTIVALIRQVPNIGSVIVINVFLGWSLVGWVVSLAMASRSQIQPNTVFVQNMVTAPPQYDYATGPAPLPPMPMAPQVPNAYNAHPVMRPQADLNTQWYES